MEREEREHSLISSMEDAPSAVQIAVLTMLESTHTKEGGYRKSIKQSDLTRQLLVALAEAQSLGLVVMIEATPTSLYIEIP